MGLLDYHLDITIWEITGVPHATGACLTSQVISTQTKLRIIKALLAVMKASDGVVKRVNRFSEKTQPLLDARNRSIHDPWLVGVDTGTVYQRRAAIVANKVDFRQLVIEKEALSATIKAMKAHNRTWYAIEDDIMAELKSLPKIWREDLPGLIVQRLIPPEQDSDHQTPPVPPRSAQA